ncbi:MAG: DOMON domain-containing protein, partial [Rhodothermales bacterium]
FKMIEVKGMKFAWGFDEDKLTCKLSAPASGWLAVGFNTEKGLAGTNLVMAAVEKGRPEISDRYILGAGDHRDVVSLGGTPAATLLEGQETATHTSVHFEINLAASDQWHHVLEEGSTIHLLLAYSQEDDFQHHSVMREHLEITL